MPAPGEYKTVQSRILTYAQEIEGLELHALSGPTVDEDSSSGK